ncbi:MAG: 50S ribosomal protein L5 [Saccharofermentanales bacterium]|nr:50S ribosomal protein L5 [Clostridiaceae bacterium]
MNRLKEKYRKEIAPKLMEQFNYSSPMEIPKLEKIVLNMGVGDAKDNAKVIESVVDNLRVISGQQPVVTKARKSIANFKLRAGMNIGVMVTLRGDRMYDFFDKLVSIALPRVRDFRGTNPNSFDGHGNYALGAREQLIFPEVDYDSIDKIRGLDIAIVTTAKTDEEAKALLDGLGMPFRK